METVSTNTAHGGVQGVYRHASKETGTEMTFSVFVPPHADGAKLPVVWYLSGGPAALMENHSRIAAVTRHALLLSVFKRGVTSPRETRHAGDRRCGSHE